jgi:hypothetical protein
MEQQRKEEKVTSVFQHTVRYFISYYLNFYCASEYVIAWQFPGTKKPVPWGKIAESPSRYVEEGSLPTGFNVQGSRRSKAGPADFDLFTHST